MKKRGRHVGVDHFSDYRYRAFCLFSAVLHIVEPRRNQRRIGVFHQPTGRLDGAWVDPRAVLSRVLSNSGRPQHRERGRSTTAVSSVTRLGIAALILTWQFAPPMAWATSSGPLADCNSAGAKQFIMDGMNQILSQEGTGFLKFARPSEPTQTAGGMSGCMIFFQDANGMPRIGNFLYYTNLAGQSVAHFQDMSPQP